jgi:hypothetical protein
MSTENMIDAAQMRAERLRLKQLRLSYNYCGICGRVPQSRNEEPNYAPLRWWDPDDGWKIGTLCHWCHDEVFAVKPRPSDYAFERTNSVCDSADTDEDPTLA